MVMDKKDYTSKIITKLDKLKSIKNKEEFSSDMNNFINLMNYCFLMKNNFFVESFNQKAIRIIYPGYNKIKSNIINSDCSYLFDTLTAQQLKSIRFIIVNAINNYERIECSIISKTSLFHCLSTINEAIQLTTE